MNSEDSYDQYTLLSSREWQNKEQRVVSENFPELWNF
jgi:hypothetical protein